MKLRMLLISLLLASNVLGKGRVTEYNHAEDYHQELFMHIPFKSVGFV
jgi:hypothetical protein